MRVPKARLLLAVAGLTAIAGSFVMGGTQINAKAGAVRPFPVNRIDQIAWQQFTLAVAPSGIAGKVKYETWASDQDIYVANPCPVSGTSPGCNKPVWPSATSSQSAKPLQHSLLSRSHIGMARGGKPTGVQAIGPQQPCGSPGGLPPSGTAAANSGFPSIGCVGEEVRRDRASFNYLVQNGLWSSAGLTAFYNAKGTVTFPTNALEVKADWIPVSALAQWLGQPQSFITANFYTATANAGPNGATAVYAMTSMHVSVKAPGYPNWIWANFENAYTPGRCDQTGCRDNFGAKIASVPAKAKAWQQYGACPKSAAATAMMSQASVAPVFANYCLTGTQTTYGTKARPTLLGSPIIEPLNANVPMASSSCISCHAGASFDATGPGNVGQPVGPNAPAPGYIGYDFMWGLLAAN